MRLLRTLFKQHRSQAGLLVRFTLLASLALLPSVWGKVRTYSLTCLPG
jgi:hypothetical protein